MNDMSKIARKACYDKYPQCSGVVNDNGKRKNDKKFQKLLSKFGDKLKVLRRFIRKGFKKVGKAFRGLGRRIRKRSSRRGRRSSRRERKGRKERKSSERREKRSSGKNSRRRSEKQGKQGTKSRR